MDLRTCHAQILQDCCSPADTLPHPLDPTLGLSPREPPHPGAWNWSDLRSGGQPLIVLCRMEASKKPPLYPTLSHPISCLLRRGLSWETEPGWGLYWASSPRVPTRGPKASPTVWKNQSVPPPVQSGVMEGWGMSVSAGPAGMSPHSLPRMNESLGSGVGARAGSGGPGRGRRGWGKVTSGGEEHQTLGGPPRPLTKHRSHRPLAGACIQGREIMSLESSEVVATDVIHTGCARWGHRRPRHAACTL